MLDVGSLLLVAGVAAAVTCTDALLAEVEAAVVILIGVDPSADADGIRWEDEDDDADREAAAAAPKVAMGVAAELLKAGAEELLLGSEDGVSRGRVFVADDIGGGVADRVATRPLEGDGVAPVMVCVVAALGVLPLRVSVGTNECVVVTVGNKGSVRLPDRLLVLVVGGDRLLVLVGVGGIVPSNWHRYHLVLGWPS